MTAFCYIGIDPGANGGLAAIIEDDIRFKTMPKSDDGIWDWISRYGRKDAVTSFAVIEWISPAMFGTGKGSMSKLYGSYRGLRMALTAADIPFVTEKAARWQRTVGVGPRKKSDSKTRWKQRLKGRCEELFPNLKVTLSTCDALLIARYCQLTQGEQ